MYRYLFIEMDGMIEGTVVDLTHCRSPIRCGSLEIKLKVYFRHAQISLVEQLRSFISRYNYEWESLPVVEDLPTDIEEEE